MIRSGQARQGSKRRAGRNGAEAVKRAANRARGFCWLLAVFGCLAAWGQPAAPADLSASVGDAQAYLSWTAASGATGYQVRHGTGSPPAFDVWTTIASTTTATVSGLTNGTRYAFEVRAVSALGSGAAARVWAALATSPSAAVTIPDAALRRQVEIWSRQSAGDTITQLEMANMSTLAGENLGISSLSGLEHALNLRLLHLGGNSITDISELYGLLSLGNLSLDRNSIFDISPLSRLTSLTWLTLTENNVSDLSALTNLTALRYLYLWQNRITNISHLSGLTELFDLQLGGNSISDVSALANMTALEGLNLSRNRLSNISSLSNLTALRVLDLSRNQISNVSSLSGLTALTRLNLLTNSISDIAPLSNLTALTWLALANNDISDISALSNLTALQRLYLSHNSISNVSSLSGLTALTLLDLFNNNSLSDISPLSTLTTLTVMSLASNMISDISHLSNLRSLRTLYLSDNSISDISHLSGLTALSSLRLAENTISDISALVANAGLATGDSVDLRTNVLNVAAVQTHIPALQTRGVTVRFDPPSAAVSATNPTPLVEGSLNNATVTVTLNSTAFASGVSASSFTLTTNVPGLTIDSVATVASGATSATLTLAHAGANFDTNRTLSVTVAAAAHMLSGDLATASVAVAPERGVTVDPTSLSLHEDPAAGGATNANVGTYSVVLTGEPQGDVTVTATSADDAVTLAADTTPLTTALTFTTSTWSTAQTVTATARQDDDEADESVLVTHTVSGYGDVTTARSVTVAVDDDEPPTAAITSPAILTSSVLPIGTGNPTISLLLTGSTFVSGVGPSSFELVTGLTTISIASATATPGSAIATLTISRGGATSWDKKFAVKVLASAHAGDTDITTPPIDAVFQDTAPSFQSATLPTRYVHRGEAIAPFQIPAASGGNDAIRYTAANLLDGLKFDATGTDANGCTAADFPAGTAAAWATAPRTVCGATTMIGGAQTIFHAHDSDSNEANSDRSSLQVDILVVRAILYDTNPSPLAEAGLNGATGNLQIYNAAFVSGATDASFELVTAIPGLSIASITPNPTTGRATFSLAFSGDFDTPQTLALKIKAAAHNRSFDIVTEALTVNPQPPADTAPTFGASTVPDQYVVLHEAMAPLQIPAASGGNGAISYVASAVRQQGIKFDATGTDADGCTASDFPSGTDAVWATAPRTLCGTPTGFASLGISIHAHDADSNRANADRDTLSFTMLGVSATIASTTPSTLTEASLNSATIEVQLVNTTFSSGVAAASFELVTDIPSISISQVSGGTSGSATSTLTLAFTGDFGTPETLAVRVKAAAHNRGGDLTTNALTIDPQGLVDTAPTFGTSTVPALYFRDGVAIAPVQLPAASGGNGALSYAVSGGRLFGLKFDATGTDADGCTASDFPPGTAPFWATAPRTLCGTPTGAGSSDTAILRVQDADSNRIPTDQSALAFEVNIYGASITSTTPSALTGTNLHDATVSVLLLNAAFASGVTAASFELVTDVPGVSISGLSGGAAATAGAILTLSFTGDFSATSTLAVKVSSAAHNRAGDLTTNAVTVPPTNTEPVFPSVAAKSFMRNVAIAPFQIPGAVGGNGAVSYAIAGLPAGLKFDLTGTDASGCTASDFPAGTAASWATEPRTICGTPTRDAESVVVFSATDEDGDVGRLMFRVTVAGPGAALGDAVPATLTEANLHGATVTVALARTSFASGVTKASFELVTTIPGLSISSISAVDEGDTQVTLTLAFTGDLSGAHTIAVKVSAAAHREVGDLTTGTLSVAATPGVSLSRDSLALDPGGSNADVGTYTVVLDALPTGCTGGVGVAVASDNADVTVSMSTLAFTTSNWDTPQTVTVTAAEDADVYNDLATLSHSIATACASGGYPGSLAIGNVAVTVDEATALLVDADPSTPGVAAGPLILDEAAALSKTYAVRLALEPAGAVTVTVTSTNVAVTVDTDSVMPGSQRTLTFTALDWNTWQTVTATTAGDADAADEASDVAHTASGTAEYEGVSETLRVGVRDDERTGTDYDTDEDGLIEITSLAQLNAVRWDVNGDGVAASSATTTYNAAFPDAAAGMGCPDVGDADDAPDACGGYELAADLDFDTDGDGSTWADSGGTPTSDSGDAYHNDGDGWLPIGDLTGSFDTTFNGNGRVIWNLFVNSGSSYIGLFGRTSPASVITSVGLANAHVQSSGQVVGTLAGFNRGRIAASWSSGSVRARFSVGGLVGLNYTATGAVVASYTTAAVECTGNGSAGGLVGHQDGMARIESSYSAGAVATSPCTAVFGLVALTGPIDVASSYWDADLSGIQDDDDTRPPEGRSTAQLQTPTAYGFGTTTLYSTWDDVDVDGNGVAGVARDPHDDAWDFGSPSQHPVLKYANFDTALQFNSQGTDLAPAFGTSTVADKTYQKGQAIAAFAVPAASGGNGVLVYTAEGLPAGLSFDAGACGVALEVCGTPTVDGNFTVTITAGDGDDNTHASDRATLSFAITVAAPSATIAATSPATLAESNLDGATLTVTLADSSFASGVTASSFTLTTDVPGLTIGSATAPPSGATSTMLTLAYTGANFDATSSLTVTVAAAAHALVGDLTTGAVAVAPMRGVTLSTSTLTVQENNSATYTVRLASRPTGGDVTVTITGAGSGITVSATSLTFTGTNWNTPQQVRVAAAEDGNAVNESVTLRHTPSGAGTDYAGVAAAELSVIAADNDTPGLGVDPQMLRIDEGTEATYAVRLNTDPGGSVTVTVEGATAAVTADTDSDRVNGNQNTLTFDSSNWDTPQTVTVSVPEDDNDTDESATLTHAVSGASTYTGLDASARPSVAVTVDDNDTPAVLIDTDPTTAEIDGGALAVTENQSVEYTVRLKTQPTGMVTVTATSAAPAVTLDEDTTPSTTALTFTTSTWATAQTVTATAQEDADSADELVSVTHTVTGYSTTTAPAVTVMVFDDDASITLTVDDDAVSEDDGATTITVTATLARATRFAKTVQVSVVGSGTATAVDFAAVSAFNITIAAGAASGTGTFTLTPTNDAVHEADETITVSGTSGVLTVNSATITLTDDQALPTVALALGPMSISENGGVSTVTATLSAASSAAVTLTVAAATGTNAVAADFSLSTAKTLTIAAGATTSTGAVTVTAVNNDVDAADKSVIVSATAAGGNGVAAPSDVTLTLTDDDTAGVTFSPTALTVTEQGASQSFTYVLDSEPTGLVHISFHPDPGLTIQSGIEFPLTYTPGAFSSSSWDTPRRVTVAGLADGNKQDETRYVKYSLSGYGSLDVPFSNPRNGVKVTVIDDDKPVVSLSLSPSSISENGGVATVTATLDAASPATTTIMVTAATGTNAVAGDFALSSANTLTIAAGSTTSTGTVTITAVNNALDEPDKSVTVSGTVSHNGVTRPTAKTLTITDDDPAPMLSISSPSVSEGDSGSRNLTFTATLSAASGRQVTVEYEDARTGTATSGTDYTAITAGTLTFAARTTSQTFNVSVTGDVLDEADETVKVRLKDPVNAAVSTTAGTGTGTITDDDATPTLSISSPSVTEGDSGSTSLTYTVTLSPASGRPVTVRYADAGTGTATSGTDYTAITAGTLTFAAGTTSRTFSVLVTGDTVNEPNETVVVTLSSPTNAMISATAGSATGTITDDDGPPTSITLTVDDDHVGEGDGATTITVTATVDGTTRFADAKTVTVSVAGSGTTGAVDFAAVSNFDISIAAGAASGAATFTLTPTDDSDDEADETITVDGTSTGLTVNSATIRLTDDDGTATSITLTVDNDSVGEGDGATTITVTATLNGTTALAATTTVSVSVRRAARHRRWISRRCRISTSRSPPGR